MKKILLLVGIAGSFLVGFGAAGYAYPAGGMYGRAEHHGYFTNANDTQGTYVLPQDYGGEAIRPSVNGNVNDFIDFIKYTKLDIDNNGSGNNQEKSGAAFIIQTMIGSARNRPPTAAQIAEWESRVRAAASQGRISWRVNYSFCINTYYQGPRGGGSPNDDAFYDECDTKPVIAFRNASGSVIYAIKWECANPVGNMAPIPDAANYSISGRTTVSPTTVKPNGTITFRHYVRNNGPTATDTSITWVAQNMPNQATVGGPANSGTYAAGQEKNVFNHTRTVPINAAVGSQICERVGYDPSNSSGGRNGRGPTVCATVIPDFNLTPTVTASATNAAEGDQITFTYQVTSSGLTASTSVACTPVGNNRPPGWSPLPQQDVARTSDGGYAPPGTSCPRVFQPNVPTTVATEVVTVGSQAPGSRLCRSLLVNPKSDAGGPRTSAEVCVTIAKTPYSWFMGNDVWAGGGFAAVTPTCNTSAKITTVGRTLSSGARAGSVGEYQVVALGQITSFGSASRVLSQYGTVGATPRMLTYSNSDPVASRLGYYGAASHCINDYTANYASSPTIGAGAYNVAGRGSGAWRVGGALTLSGTMPAGGQQVYYATGDVTISGNLTYPASYASVNDIPSLLVITTGNIYVAPGVSQMDGIFVARGNGASTGIFYTCFPKSEPITVTHPCAANQLTVNGAVLAARLDLARAFGASGATDAARQAPGEHFRFSPEMYLRSVLNSTTSSSIETTSVLDLPPRF
ncbi:MAG TPA: hypothetical protein VLA88_01495 [Candidatus Saccharimonadales bacterium]|nr:hypothetical protein [Candidatus Saccharimonadales bacterium]